MIVTLVEWVNEERRLSDQVQAPIYQHYKETRKAVKLSDQDEVRFSRCQLFYECYVGISEAISQLGETPEGVDYIYRMKVPQQLYRLMESDRVCSNGAGLATFMSSDDFTAAPYLSIRAKLMAADIVRHAGSNPENSRLTDFDIAATLVPSQPSFA